MPPRWRLLQHGAAHGAFNMGVDEALLASAIAGIATLRFYGWEGHWLSLGYAQRLDPRRIAACADAGVGIVRRVTGGRAVLHGSDLTYCLAAPETALPEGLRGSYRLVADALIAGLAVAWSGSRADCRAERSGRLQRLGLLRCACRGRDLREGAEAGGERSAEDAWRGAPARLDPAGSRPTRGDPCGGFRPRGGDESRGAGNASAERGAAGGAEGGVSEGSGQLPGGVASLSASERRSAERRVEMHRGALPGENSRPLAEWTSRAHRVGRYRDIGE